MRNSQRIYEILTIEYCVSYFESFFWNAIQKVRRRTHALNGQINYNLKELRKWKGLKTQKDWYIQT